MGFVLRAVRLLTMAVWVGGLIFFAFVLAPVAFSVLSSTHEAGMVVAGTLGVLHTTGEVCGVLSMLATLVSWSLAGTRKRGLLVTQMLLVVVMLAATLYLQRRVIPAMERDRFAAGGEIEAASADNPARVDFERLHPLSEKVEGAALFLGLGVVILMALEEGTAITIQRT